MPFRVEIEFSGLTFVHLRSKSQRAGRRAQPRAPRLYDGRVYLVGECRDGKGGRMALSAAEKPHIARLAFPLSCIVNQDYPREKLRALMSPGGALFLEFPLDGEKDVRLGDDAGPGLSLRKWTKSAPKSGRPKWSDMQTALDFKNISNAAGWNDAHAKQEATAIVRLDRGELYGGQPADWRMRAARWGLVDPKRGANSRQRIQHVSDRFCVQIKEKSTRFVIETYSPDGQRKERILLEPNDDYEVVPITVYSLCYFAGLEDEELDDVTMYGDLFEHPPKITIPKREPDPGGRSANTHSCPPTFYVS